jgi:integrase/recombinase XerD
MKTIREHIAAFADDLTLRNYSARTVSDYGYSLRSLAEFLEQRAVADVAAITAANLADFQRWLYHQPTRHGAARGVCNQNAVLAAVRSFFRFLRREGYIVRDPAAELEYAREPRRLPRNILTPAEAKRILEAADPSSALGQRDRTILEVLYATGLRRNELRHLKPGDINHDQGLLRVNDGKGGADRVVPLGAIATRCLETYANVIRPELLRGAVCEWLFVSCTGKQIDPNTLNAIVRKYAKAARIKKPVTCHTWRHSCATHLVQNNANVRHVQEMLGHRSLATTERYLRLTIADLKAAHERFHPRERGAT